MPFVGGIGSRDAILDEDGTAGAKLHGLHLCARLIYHFLRGIYIVISIVAHIVCVACRTAKRIALFGGKGEEAVDLKEFREVKAAHLATGLVELQVVLRGRDEGAGRTIHRTLSESLVEVWVEVRVETGNVEVLVELPVEVGSLPEVGTLCLIIDAVEPRLAAGKIVKRLSYACRAARGASLIVDGHVGEDVIGDLRATNHVDGALMDVTHFVGWSPDGTMTVLHQGGVEDGAECALLVVCAVVCGIHIIIVDRSHAQRIVEVPFVFLKPLKVALRRNDAFPRIEQSGHVSADGADECFTINVERELRRLHVEHATALCEVGLELSPVVVVVALCQVEVAHECSSLNVHRHGSVAVECREGSCIVGRVVYRVVDKEGAFLAEHNGVEAFVQDGLGARGRPFGDNLKGNSLSGRYRSYVEHDGLVFCAVDTRRVGEASEVIAGLQNVGPAPVVAICLVVGYAEGAFCLVPSIIACPRVVFHLEGCGLKSGGQSVGSHGGSQSRVVHGGIGIFELRASAVGEVVFKKRVVGSGVVHHLHHLLITLALHVEKCRDGRYLLNEPLGGSGCDVPSHDVLVSAAMESCAAGILKVEGRRSFIDVSVGEGGRSRSSHVGRTLCPALQLDVASSDGVAQLDARARYGGYP